MNNDEYNNSKMQNDQIYTNIVHQQNKIAVIKTKFDGDAYNEFSLQATEKFYIEAKYHIKDHEIRQLTIERIDVGNKTNVSDKKITQQITIGELSKEKLKAFLNFLSTADIDNIVNNQLKTNLNEYSSSHIATKNMIEKLSTLKYENELHDLLNAILKNPNIQHTDIINIENRKRKLKEFAEMMRDTNIKEQSWQKFFEENQWIFGYGLNYPILSYTASPVFNG